MSELTWIGGLIVGFAIFSFVDALIGSLIFAISLVIFIHLAWSKTPTKKKRVGDDRI